MSDQPQSYQNLKAIRVRAEREVAVHSPDHRVPWGTRKDNNRNWRFNQKLYKLFAQHPGPLWVLDLGCSGGGFVTDCLDDGCVAVGLEGSDFSKRFRRAEWRTIPEYLFTTDITGRFEVMGEFEGRLCPLKFDVITTWEVIEHIAEPDLGTVADNIKRHLAPNGLWILSVSPNVDIVEGVQLHQTVRPKPWWVEKFRQLGLIHRPEYVRFFHTQFVRGPKYGAPGSFHLILTLGQAAPPPIPPEGWLIWLFDAWLGCKLQWALKRLVVGA